MAGDYKNNPILRTILVVFIGVLAFGLLFNLFTGGGSMMGGEHMGNMGAASGFGLSFGSLVGGLLLLLVKLLMVVLVIAVVVGIIVWLKNNFIQNPNSQFIQSINQDPILKTISVVTLVIVGIVLLFSLLNSFSQPGMGFGGQMASFNPIYSMAGLLTLLIRVLTFVLVISLILAVVAYLKKQYDAGNLNLFSTGKNQGTNVGAGTQNNQQTPGNTGQQAG